MQVLSVFITIGTTKFEKLIERASTDEILLLLQELGYGRVVFQHGTGKIAIKDHPNLEIVTSSFFDNFSDEITKADLIISHAGAGTCLQVLKHQKPLIVVINEDLMDNHQLELAEQLSKEGYLTSCRLIDLKKVLSANNFTKFRPYPKVNGKVFSDYMDNCMGFREINKTE